MVLSLLETSNNQNMTNEIYPCLWFDGQAKAAAEFYCSVFKNSTILVDTPMVVMLEINGKKMMGLNGGPMYNITPSISMFVHCSSLEECNSIWKELSDGATVLMELDKYSWSEQYGWLKDKFGFTWQIMKGEQDKMMPSLLFTGTNFGKAEEAMDFYTTIFDNSAIDYKDPYPAETPFAGKIAYAEFNINQYPLVAMDGPGEHKFTFSEGVSFVVNCGSQEEIDYYWNKITTDGGEESRCGWCKDKYGVSWQIVPANIGQLIGNPKNGQRAMQAMMQMKKLDIAAMENA
jgi:predicted 3-demethylubiquinone-9 3-methyltransferase (glyoxalase superfamily)